MAALGLIIHSRLPTLQSDMWQLLVAAHDHVKLIPGECSTELGWSAGCAFWQEIGKKSGARPGQPLHCCCFVPISTRTALELALKWQMGRHGMDSHCFCDVMCCAVCPNASLFHVQVAKSLLGNTFHYLALGLLIKSSFPLESPSSCHWLISWGEMASLPSPFFPPGSVAFHPPTLDHPHDSSAGPCRPSAPWPCRPTHSSTHVMSLTLRQSAWLWCLFNTFLFFSRGRVKGLYCVCWKGAVHGWLLKKKRGILNKSLINNILINFNYTSRGFFSRITSIIFHKNNHR